MLLNIFFVRADNFLWLIYLHIATVSLSLTHGCHRETIRRAQMLVKETPL